MNIGWPSAKDEDGVRAPPVLGGSDASGAALS